MNAKSKHCFTLSKLLAIYKVLYIKKKEKKWFWVIRRKRKRRLIEPVLFLK
jgi:hypothetical protein